MKKGFWKEPTGLLLDSRCEGHVPAGNLNELSHTEQTRAPWTSVEPEDNVISGGIFGGDEEIVGTDEWLGLQRQVSTVHLELIGEIVVTLELRHKVLLGCSHCSQH